MKTRYLSIAAAVAASLAWNVAAQTIEAAAPADPSGAAAEQATAPVDPSSAMPPEQAAAYGGSMMSPEQMQQAQACMADVDQAELKAFEQRANQMQASVSALCASGKRDAAQQEAITFGREVSSTPTMQKMRECSEMMQGVMPGMPAMHNYTASEGDKKHICDQ